MIDKIFIVHLLGHILILLIKTCNCHDTDLERYITKGYFTNIWAVQIHGGFDSAEALAKQFGYKNLGPVTGFDDVFLMKNLKHNRRSKRHAIQHTKLLVNDKRVKWTEQQIAKVRTKRGFLSNSLIKLRLRSDDPLERGRKSPLPHEDKLFNDELWPYQWYLHDTRNIPTLPKVDLGVKEVWNSGYTGKNVVISILDDGIEWNHLDILANYDRNASYDINDNDSDPSPRYDKYDSNCHGTRCAGEIAMVPQNGKCGIGIAFNAKIGGIRCLDGEVSDAVEAMALGFNIQYIDIYSSSWGPNDDGMTVDGPKSLAIEAMLKGVRFGRNGKGCIYVWASGNGGSKGDNCNCDGYASSIYTLSIGSASQSGKFPWYGERCSSTMAVTYSSGAYTDQKIATVDLHNKCTVDHSGTSAAAPLAAGIVALALEANPNLTWRDVQHLAACTADFTPLTENKGWKINNAGFMYNSKFGFGLLAANTFVTYALNWITVPPKYTCFIKSKANLPYRLSSGEDIQINFINDGINLCDYINFLEHVQINIDIEYSKRGNLEIFIISPKGSVSMLLTLRPKDSSVLGFRNWNLTTVHFWGEHPKGQWILVVRDRDKKGDHKGKIKSATLILHGTRLPPGCLRYGPRTYQNQDLIPHTIDVLPEYDDNIYDQNNVPNILDKHKSASQMHWISDFMGIPL